MFLTLQTFRTHVCFVPQKSLDFHGLVHGCPGYHVRHTKQLGRNNFCHPVWGFAAFLAEQGTHQQDWWQYFFQVQPTEKQQIFGVLLTLTIFIHVLLIMLAYYYWFGAARSVLNTTVHHTMWYLTNKEEYVVYYLVYCRMYLEWCAHVLNNIANYTNIICNWFDIILTLVVTDDQVFTKDVVWVWGSSILWKFIQEHNSKERTQCKCYLCHYIWN